jgi:GDPmannose 4,6-dehydratase
MAALITGITGQDGAYLAKFLLEKGYEVCGTFRSLSTLNFWRLEEIGIDKEVKLVEMDLHDTANIIRVFENVHPTEIYNLAAQSFVALSFEKPILTAEVTALGVNRILEAIRIVDPSMKFYQSSSSEMFGPASGLAKNETAPFSPRSPYAISKLYGHLTTGIYREVYGIFGCCGILFNHESPLRGLEFVTRKISHAVAQIKVGKQAFFELGNLEVKRDWGFAGDYVKAMWLMLQQSKPDDFVIATGQTHSIKEFVEAAFGVVSIQITWEGVGINEIGRNRQNGEVLVRVNPKYYRPAELNVTVGDASKARNTLQWISKVEFNELVNMMVEADLRRLSRTS